MKTSRPLRAGRSLTMRPPAGRSEGDSFSQQPLQAWTHRGRPAEPPEELVDDLRAPGHEGPVLLPAIDGLVERGAVQAAHRDPRLTGDQGPRREVDTLCPVPD